VEGYAYEDANQSYESIGNINKMGIGFLSSIIRLATNNNLIPPTLSCNDGAYRFVYKDSISVYIVEFCNCKSILITCAKI